MASDSAPGASQVFQKAEVVCAPDWLLCESCRNINIENLSEGKGYTHSWLEVLETTAKWCRLCHNISCLLSTRAKYLDKYSITRPFNKMPRHRYQLTPHRYKITLSLVIDARHRKARPDHGHNSPFECINVEVFDTRPWESLEDRFHPPMIRDSKMELKCVERQQEEVSALQTCMLCHTQEGDPAVAFGLPWLRNLEYTGSSESIKVARGWLQQCLATDEEEFTKRFVGRNAVDIDDYYDNGDFGPVTPFPAERPTRLLEIVPSANSTDKQYRYSIKLIETNGRDYEYVALSYCWGEMTLAPITHTWMTQRITIEQHFEGIDLGCLPATIRDCIKVTFSLGIYHVWVDSLCIIQDDSSDWEAESAKMGGIYRGALLTIAASRSNSSSSGLFNWKKGSPCLNSFDEYLCVESSLKSGEKSCLYFETSIKGWDHSPRRHILGLEVYRSPLSQRAWAYQEQMLSRRTVYFAESQLYWECDHHRLSQDNSKQEYRMREAYLVQNFQKPLPTWLLVEEWYRGAVEAYTKRALTKPKDRLVAISAVAKATYMNRRVRYLAGLWEDCILAGLCWYRDSGGQKDHASSCPSWSWASQLSSVSYGELKSKYEGHEERDYGKYGDEELSFGSEGREHHVYLARVLNIQVESSEKNPFGNVQSGQIVLRTWATTGTVTRDRFGERGFHFEGYSGDGERTLIISEKCAQNHRTGRAVLDDDCCEDQDVVIAMVIGWNYPHLSHWLFLLLDVAEENKQRYRRIGLGIMEKDDQGKPNFEGGWEKRDITII